MGSENIIVKIAQSTEEFEQIHNLNYETFVNEISQHSSNKSKRLIDQFDSENIYYIAKVNDEIVGMIALRDKRPFSLDKKIENLDDLLPEHKSPVEVRLLSVKKEYRNSKVLLLLLQSIIANNLENTYDLAVISGILSQQRLYRHIGFQKMGSLVGNNPQFQPMFLTRERYLRFTRNLFKSKPEVLNLSPGPVQLADNVKQAFSKDPISHRSNDFNKVFNRVKASLLNLTSARYAEILTGTGTTANDAIAGQISLLREKGLIISNGEFGERLYNHADNFELSYIVYKKGWGVAFSTAEIEEKLKESDIKWLWFVHHETSTGMMNDMDSMSKLCLKYDVKLCVDVISSLGTQSVNLSHIYMASAVSSKGLASYSGLSIIFYNHDISTQKQLLPANINLSIFNKANGVPFTLSSNLLFALDQSLQNFGDFKKRISEVKTVSNKLRTDLEKKGDNILVNKDQSSSSVMTVVLDKKQSSVDLGQRLAKENILLSFESEYLVKRNWVQICFMGANPDYNKARVILDYFVKPLASIKSTTNF